MASSVALGNLEGTVEKLVASGRFHYTSEVLREGVRLVEEREKRLKLLDAALARGFADAQAGRVEPMDALLDRRAAKYGDLAEKSGR